VILLIALKEKVELDKLSLFGLAPTNVIIINLC